ncbi:DUF6985 domain-containing protein [Actinoplanes sp. G11-F43]|uniref:DUF6985 domain-containing protein n=1 Tax=Actinoplanes sp. G11-F43 TaxID=3424130 RepID=UPI003D3270A0
MEIPGLGRFTAEPDLGWYRGEPVPVPLLDGASCEFVLSGYDDDPAPADFHAAIKTFRTLDRGVLEAVAPDLHAYYRDVAETVEYGPDSILDHVRLGREMFVEREKDHVYVSVESGCDWEIEHGLVVVFRDGATVTRVGPYDGHLINVDGAVYSTGF